MKLAEIKKFISETKLPEQIRLDKASVITNPANFFESHISVMESKSNNKHIKILHYKRVMDAINIIKSGGIEKLEVVKELPKKVVEKQDNELKVSGNIQSNTGTIKPNVDFETEPTPTYSKPIEPKQQTVKEQPKPKPIPKKETPPTNNNQTSLF